MNQGETKKNTAAIKRGSFWWNAVYTGISALQPAILLIAVSRTRELSDAGILTFGFALANLVMILGRYGIRNFQVTDVNEQYRFPDYFYCRVCSTGGALAASILYLIIMIAAGQYTTYKALIILEIIILKLIDAFEGVYVGRLQQKGRLDIGARFGAIRLFLSTILMFVMLLITKSLWISLLSGIILSLILDVILIPRTDDVGNYRLDKRNSQALKQLMLTGISLCLGTALHNITGNAPKYLVEIFLNDEIQAISGYVMMPMFVITILNLFIMQPLVKDIGDAWYHRDAGRLKSMIRRQVLVISLLSIGVALLGIFVGLPVLSWMYDISLAPYRKAFIFYLIGGVFYTFSEYFMVFLVAARKQNVIVAGCVTAIAVNVLLALMLLPGMGMDGTALIYIIANFAMLLVFVVALYRTIRQTFPKDAQ